MLRSEYYKIEPINGSFVSTLDFLIFLINSKYNVEKTIHISKISPDTCRFISNVNGANLYTKPYFLYLSVHFMNDGSWTNAGGTEYCALKLVDNSKIEIRWDTGEDNHE